MPIAWISSSGWAVCEKNMNDFIAENEWATLQEISKTDPNFKWYISSSKFIEVDGNDLYMKQKHTEKSGSTLLQKVLHKWQQMTFVAADAILTTCPWKVEKEESNYALCN